jgi:hypothetical protein
VDEWTKVEDGIDGEHRITIGDKVIAIYPRMTWFMATVENDDWDHDDSIPLDSLSLENAKKEAKQIEINSQNLRSTKK